MEDIIGQNEEASRYLADDIQLIKDEHLTETLERLVVEAALARDKTEGLSPEDFMKLDEELTKAIRHLRERKAEEKPEKTYSSPFDFEESAGLDCGAYLPIEANEFSNPGALVRKYETALRRIRDQRGDDRCWMDFEELFALLPEGYTPPIRDTTVEIANCVKFLASLHNPGTTYISPEREIEQLKELICHIRSNLAYFNNAGTASFTPQQQQLYDDVWVEYVSSHDV